MAIVGGHAEDVRDACKVGEEVLVREHDTLGVACKLSSQISSEQ